MRNNKIVIAALGLILLLALAAGIYVIAGPGLGSSQSGNGIAGGGLDAGGLDGDVLGGTDGNDAPLGKDPNGSGSGTTGEGNQPSTGKSASTGEDANNKGAGKDSQDPNAGKDPTDPDPVEPAPEQQWEPVEIQATVHGRVTFKSDGRPAVGAKVSAEITDGQNFAWNRMRTAAPQPQASDRPKAEVSGTTTTDGAGEYTLVLKMKTWQSKDEPALEGNDRSGWGGIAGGLDQACIVATLAGYAPAKSAGFRPDPESDTEMNLKLAVPAAVTGRIIDAETREGIAGAQGSLQDAEAWADGGTVPRDFTTDERGYFSLNSLPASNYMLTVTAKGYASYNGWQGQGRINLTGGGEKNIGDIALMRSATVRGRVLDADNGEPVSGASIEFTQGNQWGWSPSSGVSDEDGTFLVVDVEPGSYTVKVRAAGFALLELAGQTIEAGKTLDLGDLKIDHGLTLTGMVTNADRQPVAGAYLRLSEIPQGMTWGSWGQEIGSTISSEDGTYSLSGAGVGEWRLKVTADGYASFEQKVKINGPGQSVNIQLEKGGTITGRVTDANGNPAKDVSVSCVNHNEQAYSLWKSQPTTMFGMLFGAAKNNANTAEDGTFRLENVSAGDYLLVAGTANESLAFKDNIRVENDREVSAGDIKFGGKGAARITITEDGVPVPTMTVKVSENMGFGGMSNFQGVTDGMGVAFIESIPAGTYYIRTDRDEGTFDTDMLSKRRIVIKVGETAEVTVELRPKDGVYLHGKLTMNGKATLADIILIGTGDRADVVKTTKPVEGGFYEFVGLKPGSYVLHARESDSKVTAKASLTLTQPGDVPFDRDFKGYVVSGVVNTPDNSAAQRTSVSLSINHLVNEKPEYAQWLRGRATPDADGKFRMEDVTPGTYVITASLDGVGQASTQVTIGEADNSGISITIAQNSGSIKVTVSKLNGTPVSGSAFALLSLETSEGSPVDLGENFQGFFMLSEGSAQTIPTVQPGTYTVILNGAGYISERKANIVVSNGEVTSVSMELTAAAELHLTLTNSEVTQAMLDSASVRYFDANGVEVPRESSVFDAMGQPDIPEVPTLKAKYLNERVTEVRIKLTGYAELVVPIEFAIGKKIEKQESLIAE